jgi:hypothetical protein
LIGVGEAMEKVEDGWGLCVVTTKRVIIHIQKEESIVVLARNASFSNFGSIDQLKILKNELNHPSISRS